MIGCGEAGEELVFMRDGLMRKFLPYCLSFAAITLADMYYWDAEESASFLVYRAPKVGHLAMFHFERLLPILR